MRVLITTEFYLPFQCGVTTAVLNERKCLEAIGHEVRILTISGEKDSYYKDGVYYFRSNLPKLYQDSYATLAFNDELIKDVYAWKPDIVHSQCEFFTMVYAKKVSRKLGIPLVHTCHTDFDDYGMHFTKSDTLWAWATSTFIPKLLKKADYIICPTQKIHDLLTRYGTKNTMEVIPCGLDLAHMDKSLDANERVQIRRAFSFSANDVVLVSVCRLSEEKNVGESIDHFASLHFDRPDVKFLIVGDGAQRSALEQKVADLDLQDYIKFAGNIPMDDVWKYFKVGDIFISSSISEIQGLTYIEALACSLPIVCRKDHALDMSLINGVNGYDFTDDAEFKRVILPLVDNADLRKEMGLDAVQSVGKFSLETFADNLMRVFTQVLEEKEKAAVAVDAE